MITLKILKKVFSLFLSLIFAVCGWLGVPTPAHGEKLDLSKFELTFADEFDGGELNTKVWSGSDYDDGEAVIRRGGYWSNDMLSFKDGCMVMGCAYVKDGLNGKPAGYYSAAIDTKPNTAAGKSGFEQTHGYFEIRCILPKGVGIWAAFWMLCDGMRDETDGGRNGAEIDIFESPYYSDQKYPNTVASAVHVDGYGDALKSFGIDRVAILNNPYEKFNTYGLEWNENEYIFYVNGVESGRTDFGGASMVDEYIILSIEVGGANGVPAPAWAGDPNENGTDYSSAFVVDYVRAYSYK